MRLSGLVVLSVTIFVLVSPVAARPDGASSLRGLDLYRQLARAEAARNDVPFPLVDAVMWVESRYNPEATGGVGEVGLMQILPSTAHMLGFRGTLHELRAAQTNIRLGTRYLAEAWRLARQDICTAVMKYRAGHGESRFSVRSVEYCKKVRGHMTKKGIKVAGIVPKPTFGFSSRQDTKQSDRKKRRSVSSSRTGKCFARVIQPGPRFGQCISKAALRRRGLVR